MKAFVLVSGVLFCTLATGITLNYSELTSDNSEPYLVLCEHHHGDD